MFCGNKHIIDPNITKIPAYKLNSNLEENEKSVSEIYL